MVLSFLTNPYNNYYTADLKEFIALNKSAKQDFRLDTHFDWLPGNADAFAAEIEKYAKQFGYSFLLNAPTTRQVELMPIFLLIPTQITCLRHGTG